jgi:RNase P subunit RPR2
MTVHPDDRSPLACARCGETLRYLTTMPKRFDQPTSFTVFRCDSCGHVQWEAKPARPD